jgi:hypothetical protein
MISIFVKAFSFCLCFGFSQMLSVTEHTLQTALDLSKKVQPVDIDGKAIDSKVFERLRKLSTL